MNRVASEAGWKTSVSIYYTGAEASASFTFTRMDESGNVLEAPAVFEAVNNVWTPVPATALEYEGSARIRSNSNLLVRLSYGNGESPDCCDLYLTGGAGQEWVLPNTAAPWADWTQIAFVNANEASATVILEAWSKGARVASRRAQLPARSRFVSASDAIWNGLARDGFDTAVVRASAPIPPPVLIAGNMSQDRHAVFTAQQRPQNERTLYVVNGTLIDGTGRDPVGDAVVVIRGGRILAVGTREGIPISSDADTIDANGGYILPGFINAHVHNSFDVTNLRTWARTGVTTVRDIGFPYSPSFSFGFRDSVRSDHRCARLIAAGPLVTVPRGYPIAGNNFPALTVTSPEDARAKVSHLIDQGADVIKITLEGGEGALTSGWPVLTPEEAQAIVETAHRRRIPVTAHITFAQYLQIALDAGVDDSAHSMFNRLSDAMIQRMVQSGMALVPTLMAQIIHTPTPLANLRRFVEAGGKVAMGNDGGYVAGLEVGMPIAELEAMRDGGMTPMQIIVAATKNAAEVCRVADTLGTIEFDKEADILIVRNNPLESLRSLLDVEHVIHGGTVIR